MLTLHSFPPPPGQTQRCRWSVLGCGRTCCPHNPPVQRSNMAHAAGAPRGCWGVQELLRTASAAAASVSPYSTSRRRWVPMENKSELQTARREESLDSHMRGVLMETTDLKDVLQLPSRPALVDAAAGLHRSLSGATALRLFRKTPQEGRAACRALQTLPRAVLATKPTSRDNMCVCVWQALFSIALHGSALLYHLFFFHQLDHSPFPILQGSSP